MYDFPAKAVSVCPPGQLRGGRGLRSGSRRIRRSNSSDILISTNTCVYTDVYLIVIYFSMPTGRFAMQAMKQMEPQMKQAIQSFPKTVGRSAVE